jgi:hypothetical protein
MRRANSLRCRFTWNGFGDRLVGKDGLGGRKEAIPITDLEEFAHRPVESRSLDGIDASVADGKRKLLSELRVPETDVRQFGRGSVVWRLNCVAPKVKRSGASVVRSCGRTEQVASSALLHPGRGRQRHGGLAGSRLTRLLDQIHEACRVMREPACMTCVVERNCR